MGMYQQAGEATAGAEGKSHNPDTRIPDGFTDDEMSLIRRQLDSLVRLEELRLEGEALSYDLLISDGKECTTTQDGENPGAKRLKMGGYRAIRPLLSGNLRSIRITTGIYLRDITGMYQRPSIPDSHQEALEKQEIKDWWHTYANSLFEKGKIGMEYHQPIPKIYFQFCLAVAYSYMSEVK
ncbi:hypothetical protein BGW42_001222 [Actinomortierella wolfii]|nr:hypothetical protein BGW42_001222 [Actinomortierella wolfii]